MKLGWSVQAATKDGLDSIPLVAPQHLDFEGRSSCRAAVPEWADKAIVPLILATAARDYKTSAEPVIQKIARQKCVKSLATIKFRLLEAVAATLRRLAPRRKIPPFLPP